MPKEVKPVIAGLVVIGNEILSGRTQDTNTAFLGAELNRLGIRLMEARVVADDRAAIVGAVNALRPLYDYVFTTGGVGPTHDDITAESVAAAFSVDLVVEPEAFARLERHYAPGEFNEARQRMARVPRGATLIDNPVSAAPGFQIENVFVMAGIPRIMQAMFGSIRHRLVGGKPLLSKTIRTNLGEGTVAKGLEQLQSIFADVQIGSYPSMGGSRRGVRIVCRSESAHRLKEAGAALIAMVARFGGEVEELDITP